MTGLKKPVTLNGESVPLRNIEWDTDEEGNVFLIKQKSGNRIMNNIIDFFGKSRVFRIHLDQTGSMVWENIDGENTLKDIHKIISEQKGEDGFPQGEKRIFQFVALMLKNRFVRLKNNNGAG